MPIRGEGLQDNDDNNNNNNNNNNADQTAAAAVAAGDSSRDAQKVVYVLHPNCAVEEM